jgi:hypothetical protein
VLDAITTVPRPGQRLGASGQIGRLADHALLLSGARTNEVAHHDKPGGDTDAHLQENTGGGRELRHRLDEGKPSADRALGLMLVCLRVAEIGEYSVAHVSGDEPTVFDDHLGTMSMIGDRVGAFVV